MNLPNKLTVLRFILSAVFFAVAMIEFPYHYLVALIIFIAASITDLLDGKIARKYNMITDFGKFLDPIADKMLTTAAFIVFAAKGIGWGTETVLFIVLAREFVVASIRLVAADNGKVIAANMWGKVKTVMQMIAIMLTLLLVFLTETFEIFAVCVPAFDIVITSVIWICGIATLIAGVTYAVDNRELINTKK